MQIYGTTQLLWQLANDNNLAIDDDINTGDVLTFDPSLGDLEVKEKIARFGLRMSNPVDIQVLAPTAIWTDGQLNAWCDGVGNLWEDVLQAPDAWTDGQNNALTDGLLNPFTDF